MESGELGNLSRLLPQLADLVETQKPVLGGDPL